MNAQSAFDWYKLLAAVYHAYDSVLPGAPTSIGKTRRDRVDRPDLFRDMKSQDIMALTDRIREDDATCARHGKAEMWAVVVVFLALPMAALAVKGRPPPPCVSLIVAAAIAAWVASIVTRNVLAYHSPAYGSAEQEWVTWGAGVVYTVLAWALWSALPSDAGLTERFARFTQWMRQTSDTQEARYRLIETRLDDFGRAIEGLCIERNAMLAAAIAAPPAIPVPPAIPAPPAIPVPPAIPALTVPRQRANN